MQGPLNICPRPLRAKQNSMGPHVRPTPCPHGFVLDPRVRPQYARCLDTRPWNRREAIVLGIFGLDLVGVWGVTDAFVRELGRATAEGRVDRNTKRNMEVSSARHTLLHMARTPEPMAVIVLPIPMFVGVGLGPDNVATPGS